MKIRRNFCKFDHRVLFVPIVVKYSWFLCHVLRFTSTYRVNLIIVELSGIYSYSVIIGRILSPMMWFGYVRDNRFCQILSVNGACPSLVICAVPTSVKTTPELSGPAFGVLPKTGDEELED